MSNRVLLLLVFCNIVVAVTGFLKDVSIASLLGTSASADAFSTGYFVIDTIGNSVMGSAIGIAITAAFSRLTDSSSRRLTGSFWRTLFVCAMSAFLLVVILFYSRQMIIRYFGLEIGTEQMVLKVYIIVLPIAIIYPIFYCIAGVLQARQRFLVSVTAPVFLNAVVIVTVLVLHMYHIPETIAIVRIALAIDIGCVGMLVAVSIAVWRMFTGQKSEFVAVQHETTFYAPMARVALGYVCYLALLQGVSFVERMVAAKLGYGAVAALSYAFRIGQLPIWVIISALGTVLLPRLGQTFVIPDHQERHRELSRLMSMSIQICLTISIPITIVLLALRTQIVEVLFERGAFSQHSTAVTAAFLGGYAWAILSQSIALVLFRFAVAKGNMQVPILAAIVATACNAVFDIYGTPILGPISLGLGAAIGGAVTSMCLAMYLRRAQVVTFIPGWPVLRNLLVPNLVVICLAILARILCQQVQGAIEVIVLFASLCLITAIYGIGVWKKKQRWLFY